jgi:hypothetical protein
VDLNLRFVVKEDEVYLISLWDRKQADNMQIILGDTAAKRMTCNATNVEMLPPEVTSPETGEVEMSISGVAYGSSGDDELSLVMD